MQDLNLEMSSIFDAYFPGVFIQLTLAGSEYSVSLNSIENVLHSRNMFDLIGY